MVESSNARGKDASKSPVCCDNKAAITADQKNKATIAIAYNHVHYDIES